MIVCIDRMRKPQNALFPAFRRWKECAMLNGLKTGFILFVLILLMMLISLIAGYALDLMNRSSDFLVLIGADLLLFLFFFCFILTWSAVQVFRKWWRSTKKRGEAMSSSTGMLLQVPSVE